MSQNFLRILRKSLIASLAVLPVIGVGVAQATGSAPSVVVATEEPSTTTAGPLTTGWD